MKLLEELKLDRCPHCRVSHPRLAISADFHTTEHSGDNPRHWRCYNCSSCGGVVTATARKGDGSRSVIEYYPQLQTTDEAIPDRARDYLNQAIESLHAPAGAVMLCASSVDAMLKEKNYKEGSLYPLFQSKDEPEEMIRVGCGRTDCNSADEAIGDRPRAFHQEPGRPDFSFPAAQA